MSRTDDKRDTKFVASGKLLMTGLVLFCLSGPIQAQMHLDGYLQTAAEQNPGLKAKFSLYLAALERVEQEGTLPDPTLSFGYFVSPVETRVGPQRFRLALSQMFPWMGTLKVREQAAASMAKIRFYEFEEARNKLFLEVRHKWLELYEIRKELDIMKSNLDLLRSYEPVTKTKYEANLVSLADLIRVQISIDHAEAQLKILALRWEPALGDFNVLLNRDPSRDVFLVESLMIESGGIYFADSIQEHQPQISRIDAGLATLEQESVLAALKRKPNIGFGLEYAMVGKRTDVMVSDNGKDILVPTVSLSLPVFRKKNRALERELTLKKESYQAQRTQVENELNNDWLRAENEMESALEELSLYESEIEKTNVLVRILTSEYTNNHRDFEDLLSAQQRLLQLQLALVKARVKYHHGLHKKDYLTGYTLNRIK
ncbi:MAG: hypothetical protein Roseis2KO_51350 [Roseivirga sp.]